MNPWIRLEPELELDGSHSGAWRLIIEFSNDWQGWGLKGETEGGPEFRVEITDEMLTPKLKEAIEEMER